MATKAKIEIKGINEVKRMLRELPKEINEKIQYDLHRKAGLIVKKEIEAATPSGNNDKSSKDKAENNVTVAKERGSKSGVLVGFRRRAWYATLLERGTKVRTLRGRGKYRKGTKRGKITAKPFIVNAHKRAFPKALDYLQRNYLRIVNNSIKKQLRSFKK